MLKLKKQYTINAPIEKVWTALTVPSKISKWGAGPAKMSIKEGYKFSLWGGDIFGTNIKVTAPTYLEQSWFGSKEWKSPSKVKFILKEQNGSTVIYLEHSNFPKESSKKEILGFSAGWDEYYFGVIKNFLEN